MRYGGSSIRRRVRLKPWALPWRLGTRHCIQTHSLMKPTWSRGYVTTELYDVYIQHRLGLFFL